MKKYLVIGNPIKHSLSPKIHNHWIKENNLAAVYDKRQLNETDIKGIVLEVKTGKIDGINVTVPFKKSVIPFLDQLTSLATKAQSVNTIFRKDNKVVGDNTDIGGFELGLKHINYDLKNKKVFILGAGGVASSIIIALKRLGVTKITLSNRTIKKTENLKKIYPDLEIINWGEVPDFNMIINATSLGLKSDDEIKLNYSDIGSNKLFYDVIYNPSKTNFLIKGKKFGNQIENGKMMFIYQAQLSFEIWHSILPKIDNKIVNLLND
jgi:shikimate dehydrogenase